jgi:hypothetical protein
LPEEERFQTASFPARSVSFDIAYIKTDSFFLHRQIRPAQLSQSNRRFRSNLQKTGKACGFGMLVALRNKRNIVIKNEFTKSKELEK